MLNFQDFFNSKRTLKTTFGKTRKLTSRKYIAEEGIDLLKPSQKHELLRSHFSKMLFLRGFILKKHWWPLSMKCVQQLPENM